MESSITFPTRQAATWAARVGLYDKCASPVSERGDVEWDWDDWRKLLQDFQQLAVAKAPFKIALLCYEHLDLSDEQKNRLQLIYNTTEAQVRGYATNLLTDKMENENGKNLVEAGKLLFQEALSQSMAGKEGVTEGILKIVGYEPEDLNA